MTRSAQKKKKKDRFLITGCCPSFLRVARNRCSFRLRVCGLGNLVRGLCEKASSHNAELCT